MAPPKKKPKRKRKRKRTLKRRLRNQSRPLRHALEIGLYHFLMRRASRMSHEGALTWGRRLGRLFYRLPWSERRVLRKNLELALGADLTPAQREAIEAEFFESLGMLAFEAAQSATWKAEDYLEKVVFEGDEHWRAALEQGKGMIFVTAHLGNWELMHPAFYCYSGVATGIISRDVTNPRLNPSITAFRGRMGNAVFSNEQSAVGYLKLLRKGGVLAMLADQDSKRIRCEYIQFFGRPASTPIGPGFLSRRCGAPIVPVYIRRLTSDPTRHRIRFYPPIYPNPDLEEATDAWRMVQEASECLEQEIREAPEQWVWIHNRWGRQPNWKERRLLNERLEGRT